VARGRARVWNQDVPVEVPRLDVTGAAVAYIRPEDIELSLRPWPDSIGARIEHIAAFGPVVRVEMAVAGTNEPLSAEMPRAKLRELQVTVGDQVHVRARTARVFSDVEDAAA
jgi:sulfate transport system ATP-binding protein